MTSPYTNVIVDKIGGLESMRERMQKEEEKEEEKRNEEKESSREKRACNIRKNDESLVIPYLGR